MYKKIKKRVYEIFEKGQSGDILSKVIDIAIIFLIVINVICVYIETFNINDTVKNILAKIEIVSVIIFTIEYIARLWTADLIYPKKGKITSRLRYMVTTMAIIDLTAILPFYISLFTPLNLRVLRVVRLARIFRLLKLNRYTQALDKIGLVLKKKSAELLTSISIVFLLMLISSILMYTVESPYQPEVFTDGLSGLWWAVATFTTVGYGDIYPVTAIGKLLSTAMALLGIGMVAVPTGIISSGFLEVSSKRQDQSPKKDNCLSHGKTDGVVTKYNYCPYCGKKLSDQ